MTACRAILAFALGVVLALSSLLLLPSPIDHEASVKRSVALLGLTGGGNCSGTMVAPNVLLTASHCLESSDLLTVNNTPVNVDGITHDGADHALVTLDTEFPNYTPLVLTGMAQGDRLFMYGNPANRQDLLRRGYVSGFGDNSIYVDFPVGFGDSGAGVFNDQGQLVGMVSGYAQHADFLIGLVRPFAEGFGRE
jgi:hypothetical protein